MGEKQSKNKILSAFKCFVIGILLLIIFSFFDRFESTGIQHEGVVISTAYV
jgi:hypothetical protein